MGKDRNRLRAENRQYRRLLKDMKKQLEGQRNSLNRLQSLETKCRLQENEVVALEHALCQIEKDFSDHFKKGHLYRPEFFLPETKEFLFEKTIPEELMRIYGKSRCTFIAKAEILNKVAGELEKARMIQFNLRNKDNDFVYRGRICVVVPEPEFPKKEKELI